MGTIHILFNNDYVISEKDTPNFKMHEFYTTASPDQEWDCPIALIDAVQVIRTWMGWPIIITSTFRQYDTWGPHKDRLAIDFILKHGSQEHPAPISNSEMLVLFRKEVLNYRDGIGSIIVDKLRQVGITGFGLEPACIHLDCGNYGFNKRINHKDQYGIYTIFEWNYSGLNRSI